MRIERKDGVKVKDIQVGECFLLDGDVCLKVDPGDISSYMPYDDDGEFTQWFINIEKGTTIERIVPDFIIKPLTARIIIE